MLVEYNLGLFGWLDDLLARLHEAQKEEIGWLVRNNRFVQSP